jgi:hypothetical protein
MNLSVKCAAVAALLTGVVMAAVPVHAAVAHGGPAGPGVAQISEKPVPTPIPAPQLPKPPAPKKP